MRKVWPFLGIAAAVALGIAAAPFVWILLSLAAVGGLLYAVWIWRRSLRRVAPFLLFAYPAWLAVIGNGRDALIIGVVMFAVMAVRARGALPVPFLRAPRF